GGRGGRGGGGGGGAGGGSRRGGRPGLRGSRRGRAVRSPGKARAARWAWSAGARQSVRSRHIPCASTRAAPRSGSSGTNAPSRRSATRAARSSAPDSTATSRSAGPAARADASRASRTAPPTSIGDALRPAAVWTARRRARAGGVRWSSAKRDGRTIRGRRGRRPGTPTTLPELDASGSDPVLDDLVAHGAAPVLDDAEHARQPVTDALAAEDQDRVGGGADVAGGDLAGQQVLEPRLLRRHQE